MPMRMGPPFAQALLGSPPQRPAMIGGARGRGLPLHTLHAALRAHARSQPAVTRGRGSGRRSSGTAAHCAARPACAMDAPRSVWPRTAPPTSACSHWALPEGPHLASAGRRGAAIGPRPIGLRSTGRLGVDLGSAPPRPLDPPPQAMRLASGIQAALPAAASGPAAQGGHAPCSTSGGRHERLKYCAPGDGDVRRRISYQ